MKLITLTTEQAKAIIKGIEDLYSEGLLKDELYYLGILILYNYFKLDDKPYWVEDKDWEVS